MTKVIYCEWSTDFFLDVAKKLRDNHGWEPVLWVTTGGFFDKIRKEFPETLIMETYDAMKGRYPGVEDSAPLDEILINRMMHCESVSVRMMDKMDFDNSFGYGERLRLYYVMLRFWNNVLDQTHPDMVIFPYSPHCVYDYVLYSLCLDRGIETFMFEFTSIDGMIYPMSRFDRGCLHIDDMYEDRLFSLGNGELSEVNISEEAGRYIDRILGNYQNAIPVDMKEWIIDPKRPKKLFDRLVDAVRLAMRLFSPTPNYMKQRRKSIEDSDMSGLEYRIYKFRANRYKRKLRKYYDSLCELNDDDLKDTYIYVPLHYQPERSTSPGGGVYSDQLLMLYVLESCLPDCWYIYVKEHPAQLDSLSHGERSRSKRFYDYITSLRNTKLVPMSYSSFDLIDHAVATATVTGTSGWESVIRGKPALVFGRPWYSRCEGVLPSHNAQMCKLAIDSIIDGYRVDSVKVRLFISVIEEVCLRGYVVDSHKSVAGVTYQENVEAIYNSMVKYYNL